jgi:hypothetical protein
VKCSVLVEVVKEVEVLERSRVGSTVRLHCRDEVPRFWIDASDHSFAVTGAERGVHEDRELGVLFDFGSKREAAMGNREVVGEMIEGGAEVEQALPNECAPADQRRSLVDLHYPEALALPPFTSS